MALCVTPSNFNQDIFIPSYVVLLSLLSLLSFHIN
jgi:hypothetical protein